MTNSIIERKRHKILQVYAGCDAILPLLHEVDQFIRSEEIFDWLIQNKLTGSKFFEFYAAFEFSKLRFGKYVLSKIEKNKKLHLIAGKDI